MSPAALRAGLLTHYPQRWSVSAAPHAMNSRPLVGAIALEEGLQVNFRKTRVMTRARRQQVTGVVVNEKPNLRRDAYDRLKATLHNCVRLGPRTQNRAGLADFRAHLAGRVAHAAMLNPARGARLRGLFDRIKWDG